MDWSWVCVGVAVATLVAWIVFRGAMYHRLFAVDHLLEVGRGVCRIKAAALDKVIALDEHLTPSPADPRAQVTTAGLALFYTIGRVEDRFVHHYSVSVAGGYTAPPVGETFVLLVAKLLGVPFEALTLGMGQSTVYHAEFQLSAAEQSEFAMRQVAEVSQAEIVTFRSECAEARRHLR